MLAINGNTYNRHLRKTLQKCRTNAWDYKPVFMVKMLDAIEAELSKMGENNYRVNTVWNSTEGLTSFFLIFPILDKIGLHELVKCKFLCR